MSASDVSPPFHHLFHPSPDTCRWSAFGCVCVLLCLFLFVVFVFACFLVLQVSGDFLPFLRE